MPAPRPRGLGFAAGVSATRGAISETRSGAGRTVHAPDACRVLFGSCGHRALPDDRADLLTAQEDRENGYLGQPEVEPKEYPGISLGIELENWN